MKALSLCDGLSGAKLALKQLGIECEVHAVEIDEYARKLADYNSKLIRWENDVTKITREQIKENGPYDIVFFGSPCTSVSIAGKQEGLDGESKLLIDCIKILRWCQEDNPKLLYLIENVKMKKKFLDQFDEIIGHSGVLINAALVSAQGRERYYWTHLEEFIQQPKDRGILFKDILQFPGQPLAWSKSTRYEDENGKITSDSTKGTPFFEQRFRTDGKANTATTGDGCGAQSSKNFVIDSVSDDEFVYLTQKEMDYMAAIGSKGKPRWDSHYHNDCEKDKSRTVTANYKRGVPYNVLIDSTRRPRKLTVRECARLQTIPEDFDFSIVSRTQAYKCIGNGWCIEVIVEILKQFEIYNIPSIGADLL